MDAISTGRTLPGGSAARRAESSIHGSVAAWLRFPRAEVDFVSKTVTRCNAEKNFPTTFLCFGNIQKTFTL